MNDVALRANDVLRTDVGLRPMKLRFAQTELDRSDMNRKKEITNRLHQIDWQTHTLFLLISLSFLSLLFFWG